ncbi:hypothetical protein GCM10010249_30040 [Streptomyces roseolilacinus]|uniref:Uncharacterized protein n=1 Tax=Streptomyces roseolilacinus TaxID=66904 RepID=A0A918B0F5_9ACTN|nr:hypothetical protein GCM10010249_30040 [Streptomyces roseolilacinus]
MGVSFRTWTVTRILRNGHDHDKKGFSATTPVAGFRPFPPPERGVDRPTPPAALPRGAPGGRRGARGRSGVGGRRRGSRYFEVTCHCGGNA